MKKIGFIRASVPRAAGLAVVLMLYGLTEKPEPTAERRSDIADRFQFTSTPFPTLPGAAARSVRPVHPSLKHIDGWISAVGAAVALAELDGDGLANDYCLVDPRDDSVTVGRVLSPETSKPPASLDPRPLPYAPETMAPMGCLPGDFDEDGAVDLLVYYWGRTPILFLREREHERYRPTEVVSAAERWFTNSATSADFDGDGHVDVIFANYFPDGAEILDTAGKTPQAMQRSMSRASNGGRKHLLLWSGVSEEGERSVRFREVADIFRREVDTSWTLAVGAADLDGDLLPELYLANDFGPDRLLHNRSARGKPAFAELSGERHLGTPASKVLGSDSFKGMGVDFGDVNGDGRLDIWVSNIAEKYALLESNLLYLSTGDPAMMKEGRAPYTDSSGPLGVARSSWGWDAKLADFDNDGVLEVLQAAGFVRGSVNRWPELQELATANDVLLEDPRIWPRFGPDDDLSGHVKNPFFVLDPELGRYVDVAPELDLPAPAVCRGIAIADADGDGDLDFATAHQWGTSYFHENRGKHPGAFLGLRLRLPLEGGRSRAAIGAQAMVYVAGRDRPLIGHVDGGNGHSGKRSPEVFFGLGRAAYETSMRVELRWRASDGRARARTLSLKPGWHTVELVNRRVEMQDLRLAALLRFATAITLLNVIGHLVLGFEAAWAHILVSMFTAYATELVLETLEAWSLRRRPLYAGGARTFFEFLLPAHITAMACAMLLYAQDDLLPIAFASACAIASKALLGLRSEGRRRRHFLNPSNTGIAVTLILFPWVGISPPYQFTEKVSGLWDVLIPVIIITLGTFLNARFTRRIPLIAGWLGGFAAQAIIRSLYSDVPVAATLAPMTGMAFILYTFYMVTDPATTPSAPREQVLFGAAVAAAYSVLQVVHVVFGLFFALFAICGLRMALEALRSYARERVVEQAIDEREAPSRAS